MSMEHCWSDTDWRKPKYLEKTGPSAAFSTINPHVLAWDLTRTFVARGQQLSESWCDAWGPHSNDCQIVAFWVWCCITGWILTDIWKDCTASIFTVKQCSWGACIWRYMQCMWGTVCSLTYCSIPDYFTVLRLPNLDFPVTLCTHLLKYVALYARGP
jgi:hypothetical protein